MLLEDGPGEDDDLEATGTELPPRPISHIHALKVGLAMILVVLTNALAISNASYLQKRIPLHNLLIVL